MNSHLSRDAYVVTFVPYHAIVLTVAKFVCADTETIGAAERNGAGSRGKVEI